MQQLTILYNVLKYTCIDNKNNSTCYNNLLLCINVTPLHVYCNNYYQLTVNDFTYSLYLYATLFCPIALKTSNKLLLVVFSFLLYP